VPCPSSTVPRGAHRRPDRPTARWSEVAHLLTSAGLLVPGAARGAPKCTVSAAGGLVFGTYDTFVAAPVDSQLTVTVKCPKPLVPRLLLSRGSAPAFVPRTLQNGSEILTYNVYLDAARTVVFGDGTGGSSFWDGPGGTSVLNGFGRIPPGQDVAVGTYTDTLSLTVLF
jgi:spore coat protein U-like protein